VLPLAKSECPPAARGGDCPVAMPLNRLGSLLRKIELFMSCSVGFKYAKNALAAEVPPWSPLGELTLPQTSYSGVDGRGGKGPCLPNHG